MSKRRKIPQCLYAATSEAFGARFYFHAASQEDAETKVDRWNHYHSFTRENGGGWHTAVRATHTPHPDTLHDDYVR
jgi:hypothetical protein